jgi:hypothetical protein
MPDNFRCPLKGKKIKEAFERVQQDRATRDKAMTDDYREYIFTEDAKLRRTAK